MIWKVLAIWGQDWFEVNFSLIFGSYRFSIEIGLCLRCWWRVLYSFELKFGFPIFVVNLIFTSFMIEICYCRFLIWTIFSPTFWIIYGFITILRGFWAKLIFFFLIFEKAFYSWLIWNLSDRVFIKFNKQETFYCKMFRSMPGNYNRPVKFGWNIGIKFILNRFKLSASCLLKYLFFENFRRE